MYHQTKTIISLPTIYRVVSLMRNDVCNGSWMNDVTLVKCSIDNLDITVSEPTVEIGHVGAEQVFLGLDR
jgi:hypothetical protein